MQALEQTVEIGQKKTRIAIVVLRDDPNDGRLARQYSSLVKSNFDVKKFATFTGNSDQRINLTDNAFLRPFLYRARRTSVLKDLKLFKPELIISHEPEALSVTGQYLKNHKVPHIYDAHEFYDAQRGVTADRKAWLKKIYTLHGHNVTALITVSPGLIDLYRQEHPSLPQGILIANAARKPQLTTYDGRLHDQIGVKRDTKVMLYQGGLWDERGIEDVCDASTLLPPDWVTVIMGYGPLFDKLPRHNKLYVISAKPQAELIHWTAGASLGVIPYPDNTLNHKYCLPNKLWEYPSAGVPIIARNLVDMSEIIRSSKIGVLFPTNGNGADIAKVVSNIDAKTFSEMKEKCREFAQIENWEKYESIYLKLIDDLLSG